MAETAGSAGRGHRFVRIRQVSSHFRPHSGTFCELTEEGSHGGGRLVTKAHETSLFVRPPQASRGSVRRLLPYRGEATNAPLDCSEKGAGMELRSLLVRYSEPTTNALLGRSRKGAGKHEDL